jgi:hypothetical protein
VQTFRTSTPRVIGVELDLDRLRLRYWIDGKPLDDMAKTVPPGKAWIPTVHFLEKDLEVVLNPFSPNADAPSPAGQGPKAQREAPDEAKAGGQASLPACLSRPTAPLLSALLAAELDQLLVALNFRTHDPAGGAIPRAEVLLQAERLSPPEGNAVGGPAKEPGEESKEGSSLPPEKIPAPELAGLPAFQIRAIPSAAAAAGAGEEAPVKYALLKFATGQDALKYLVMAKRQQCWLQFLSSHDLARLLQLSAKAAAGAPGDRSALAARFPAVENAELLAADVAAALRATDLIAPEAKERLAQYGGLPQERDRDAAREDLREHACRLAGKPLQAWARPRPRLASRGAEGSGLLAAYLPSAD